MSSLLDRRLVVVTGKGGVGKTTVSAALGLKAARAGKRTVICEVASQERLSGIFGVEAGRHRETELAPGLAGISIDPESAKQEWLQYQLRSSRLAGLLGHSRIFQYLTAAAPGLDELVTIGKVWELAQLERKTAKAPVYDLAIVDAPATGHGLAMLAAPQTFSDVARVGPIHRQAGIIHRFLADPSSTAIYTVALPEEMPVNETLELGERLEAELERGIDQIVMNGVLPERFSKDEAARLETSDVRGQTSGAQAAITAALTEYRRARGQRSQLRRLRRAAAAPASTLPYLFEPSIGVPQLETLAAKL